MKFTFVIAALFAVSAIAAPCGKKHVGDDLDNTGSDVDTSLPPPVVTTHDHDDEIKTVTEKKESHNEQTAVINDKSPQGSGGHGSLIGVSADNLLSDGLLNHKTNSIQQNND